MRGSLKDLRDDYDRFQLRDDEIAIEMEATERRDMQDPLWITGAGDVDDLYVEPPYTGPFIDFEESCIVGRGDLLHLAVKMFGRR